VIERCDEIIAEAPVAPIENLAAAPIILDQTPYYTFANKKEEIAPVQVVDAPAISSE